MSALEFLAIAVAGGLGASARLLVDGFVKARTRGAFPWGTVLINLSGSLLLGLLAGLALAHAIPESLHEIAGTGFLGGYTTFSTASFETVRMLQERRIVAGAMSGLGVLAATVALAGLGMWIGSLL